MTSKKFSELKKCGYVFSLNKNIQPARIDGIRALRLFGQVDIDLFPYDMKSLGKLKKIHQAISSGQFVREINADCLELMVAIPAVLYLWFSKFSFDQIQAQWVESAARFMHRQPDRTGVIFNQSAAVLVQAIQNRWRELQKGDQSIRIKIPKFLNHDRFEGNYKGIIENYGFKCWIWGCVMMTLLVQILLPTVLNQISRLSNSGKRSMGRYGLFRSSTRTHMAAHRQH